MCLYYQTLGGFGKVGGEPAQLGCKEQQVKQLGDTLAAFARDAYPRHLAAQPLQKYLVLKQGSFGLFYIAARFVYFSKRDYARYPGLLDKFVGLECLGFNAL